MNRKQLETLETEVNAELHGMAMTSAPLTGSQNEPITDGVVDIKIFLRSRPKILWILKEPRDEIENGMPRGGGWSITKDVLALGKFGNSPPFAPIAYVTYAVFNNFKKWADIAHATEDPQVKESIKRIAFINVNKMPALPTSHQPTIEHWYRQNQHILVKQIDGIRPDIIIGGSTLYLFFEHYGLDENKFRKHGSARFCVVGNRLYIAAYHPSQRKEVAKDVYVDDLVEIIRSYSPVLPPRS